MKPEAVHIRIRRMIVDHAVGRGLTAAQLAEAIQSELSGQVPIPASGGQPTAPLSRRQGTFANLVATEIANRLGATSVGFSFAAAGQDAAGRGGRS